MRILNFDSIKNFVTTDAAEAKTAVLKVISAVPGEIKAAVGDVEDVVFKLKVPSKGTIPASGDALHVDLPTGVITSITPSSSNDEAVKDESKTAEKPAGMGCMSLADLNRL